MGPRTGALCFAGVGWIEERVVLWDRLQVGGFSSLLADQLRNHKDLLQRFNQFLPEVGSGRGRAGGVLFGAAAAVRECNARRERRPRACFWGREVSLARVCGAEAAAGGSLSPCPRRFACPDGWFVV